VIAPAEATTLDTDRFRCENHGHMQSTSWKAIALVLTGIIVGCSANAMRGAQAQQPGFPPSPSATAWQQYCEAADDADELNQRVRAAGAQGFELVSCSLQQPNSNDLIVCFKRPAV
jgi:hypothetical protein